MRYLITLPMLLVSSLAMAWFPIAAQVQVTGVSVTVAAENVYPYPVACQGELFAQTASEPAGISLPYTMLLPYPGQWAVANITAPLVNLGDYFIAAPQAVLWCQYY